MLGGTMERTSMCVVCVYYGCMPAELSVDPACQSKDEADALCVKHRAVMTEGMCVLCGRREPWVSPWPNRCVQRRLTRPAGYRPVEGRSQTLVATVAGRREIDDLKPIVKPA